MLISDLYSIYLRKSLWKLGRLSDWLFLEYPSHGPGKAYSELASCLQIVEYKGATFILSVRPRCAARGNLWQVASTSRRGYKVWWWEPWGDSKSASIAGDKQSIIVGSRGRIHYWLWRIEGCSLGITIPLRTPDTCDPNPQHGQDTLKNTRFDCQNLEYLYIRAGRGLVLTAISRLLLWIANFSGICRFCWGIPTTLPSFAYIWSNLRTHLSSYHSILVYVRCPASSPASTVAKNPLQRATPHLLYIRNKQSKFRNPLPHPTQSDVQPCYPELHFALLAV